MVLGKSYRCNFEKSYGDLGDNVPLGTNKRNIFTPIRLKPCFISCFGYYQFFSQHS